MELQAIMAEAGLSYSEIGVTAIDSYRGYSMKAPIKFFSVEGGIVDLARLFESIDYPGLPYADASLGSQTLGYEARFVCREEGETPRPSATALGSFRRDPSDGRYFDPRDCYPSLRSGEFFPVESGEENALFENAVLLSRFPGSAAAGGAFVPPRTVSPLWQRDLLSLILQSTGTVAALEFLKDSGFVALHWPELAALLLVDHSKDCHPEGGGWSHTMEALGYRKSCDLVLSLAILLHDIGKPRSESAEGRRFDRHAEIGAAMAARFLATLGFDEKTIGDVRFMIRWHMMPAALPRIPLSSVENVVFDPRFPVLLELYRCDEFSTFKGPDAYYETCAAYRSILRHAKNPYRDPSGRKKTAQAFFSVRS
jgi:poly(A) polymerase